MTDFWFLFFTFAFRSCARHGSVHSMMKIPRIDYKLQVLEENNTKNCSLCEYIRNEAENDPGFFRWLFEDENLSDFECPDADEFNEFLLRSQDEERQAEEGDWA